MVDRIERILYALAAMLTLIAHAWITRADATATAPADPTPASAKAEAKASPDWLAKIEAAVKSLPASAPAPAVATAPDPRVDRLAEALLAMAREMDRSLGRVSHFEKDVNGALQGKSP